MQRVLGVLLGFLLLIACQSAERTTSEAPQEFSSTDRIVVSELSYSVEGLSAYDLVVRTNSNWLTDQSQRSINAPANIRVYVDGVERQPPRSQVTGSGPAASILRTIDAEEVAVIEHLGAQEAQQAFGVGHLAGAIHVHTKGGSLSSGS